MSTTEFPKRSETDELRFMDTVRSVELHRATFPSFEDLAWSLRELEKADAFGTIVDPTTWRRCSPDRSALRPLLEAARAFAAAGENFEKARGEILARRKG